MAKVTTGDNLTPEQLSERWQKKVSVRSLANWRAAKPRRGPKFMKIGHSVLYSLAAVEAFERKRTL